MSAWFDSILTGGTKFSEINVFTFNFHIVNIIKII